MTKSLFFGLFFILIVFIASGQEMDTAKLYLKSRVQKDGILLRWAPDTPLAWKRTNNTGFRLERYTIVRDGIILETPEKITWGPEVIRALPLEAWEEVIRKNDFAAIVAQALFGERFELDAGKSEISRIIYLSEELDQRFSFSLYAADQNFEAACMAGWGWKDTLVRKGEYYLYRVLPGVPEDSAWISMGLSYTSLDEWVPLSAPTGLSAIWDDKRVLLSWDYFPLSTDYSSFYIERSGDSINFDRLPGAAVTSVSDKEVEGNMMYLDSLPDNSGYWYYRVRGITPFGEVGPPSEIIRGRGINKLTSSPVITGMMVNAQGILELSWEFDKDPGVHVTGFELQQARSANGDFKTVMENIPSGSRYLEYDNLYESNYFVIAAITDDKEVAVSFPVLVQPLDTIPPLAPVGVHGSIDTNGVVKIFWNPNKERDLLGYRVFRANQENEEPVYLLDTYIQDTFYLDKVEVGDLNRYLYYYVIALDKRYNQSDYSTVLKLKKPDVIPPVSPLISGYKVKEEGIEIEWVNSPDADVEVHLLYRKIKGDPGDSVLIYESRDPKRNCYLDGDIKEGVRYTYFIFASDSSGLISAPTPSLTAYSNKSPLRNREIDRFDAVVDRENLLIKLLWQADLEGIKYFEIFKGTGEEDITLWKVLPAQDKEVLDTDILLPIRYTYVLRGIFEDGRSTDVKTLKIY